MCAKAKKTYGGLDKESLAQSGVFPVEKWSMSRECVKTRVHRASSARRPRETVTGSGRNSQVATSVAVALRLRRFDPTWSGACRDTDATTWVRVATGRQYNQVGPTC
ncbi:hypothetical protein Taro_027164 [Colocasia esculenta]|uniref:Uncharacterized protein n=1 Tax=Colocasia esculenta TaxID=4460 RepID=A0A843VHA4_COLES|nr:hypothetical protein [Colocasia esculenta]